MDEEAVRALLAGSTGGGTNAMTTAEQMRFRAASAQGQSPQYGTFVQRNLRGMPIDTETGVPAWVKFQVGRRDDPDKKVAYLEEIYGKGNARLADTGEPLIKVVGADGKPKEVKVDEDRFTMSDFATLAAHGDEIAGGIAGLVAGRYLPGVGRSVPLLRQGVTRDVVAQSVGGEVGGLIGDPAPLTTQAVKERAANLPLSVAMGGVLEAGARAMRVASPFAGTKGTIEEQQAAARQYFRERFQIDVPMTAGEETGSTALKRVEATMGRLPGSSEQFKDIRLEKQDRLARIQNRMLDLPEEATPADRLARLNEEGIGEQATEALQRSVRPQQESVEAARTATQRAATGDVVAQTDTAAMTSRGLQSSEQVARNLHPERVGAGIRTRAFAERQSFQQQSEELYSQAYALPGGKDRTLTPESLPDQAKALLDELPSKKVITEEPTGVLGPSGKPITKTAEGREVLKEFIPSGVMGKLKELSELEGQQFSLQDLVRMRSEVSNEIARGEAVPGVQTHFLNRIRETLTGAIEEATGNLPDGQLKAAWKTANDFYRSNVGRFQDTSIARLFKDIESRGFIQDEDIVRNIGPTEYASFKKFLGESSPEFQALKRSIADTVINAATPLEGGIIDGAALVQQLKAMRDKNKAVFDDIFGPHTRNFQQLSDVLSVGNARVDEAKFRELIASGTPTGEAVRKLVQEQKKLDGLYRSDLLKQIADKKVGDAGFNPTEFVNRFYDKASMRDIRAVVDQLHDQPELLEGIRKNVVEKVFHEAQRTAKDLDPSRLGRGEIFRPSSSSSLDRVFGDELKKEKLELILGRQTFQDFEQLAKLLRGSEMTEAAFAGAGGLAAGMQVTNMMRHGVFSYATDYVKQKLYAIFLTNPAVKRVVTNEIASGKLLGRKVLPSAEELGTALLVSKPFIEAVMDEFGTEAENVMEMLKASAERTQGAETPESRARSILAAPE